MSKKKKNDITNWRNEKKDIFAIIQDNKKYLMPAILIIAVIITVVIAVSASKRATDPAQSNGADIGASNYEIPDVTMEENAYPEVNALVEKYYTASANGDEKTIREIYKGLEDTEILKAVAASEYIEKFDNIVVYTKPGPIEGSYVAYVYNEVKLYDYDGTVPGLETLYICPDASGNLYINGDIADQNELDYLKQINVQSDVIDLNNKVASSYNEMVSADESLAELLTKMRSGLQVSVGEALATSEASAAAASDEASEGESSDEVTVTSRVIKATDVINIRSSDSETADILDKTTVGQEFKELEALANGWSKVEYKGGTAYVKTEFFEVVSEETTVVKKDDSGDGKDTSADAASSASSESSAAASSASSSESSAASSSASTGSSSSASSSSSTSDSSTASSSSSGSSSSSSDSKSSLKKDSDAKTGKLVVTESIKLRKEPSTESDSQGTIFAGETVNVIEQYTNGWAKVEYNKKQGYIKSEFLRQ